MPPLRKPAPGRGPGMPARHGTAARISTPPFTPPAAPPRRADFV